MPALAARRVPRAFQGRAAHAGPAASQAPLLITYCGLIRQLRVWLRRVWLTVMRVQPLIKLAWQRHVSGTTERDGFLMALPGLGGTGLKLGFRVGAGDGNRTRMTSLEDRSRGLVGELRQQRSRSLGWRTRQ